MAAGFSTTLANAALDLLDNYRWIQLHVGSPGLAGTGNPAATTLRIQTTWAAATGGVKRSSVDTTWAVTDLLDPAGTVISHWSAWSLVSGGVYGGSGTITALALSAGRPFVLPAGPARGGRATGVLNISSGGQY